MGRGAPRPSARPYTICRSGLGSGPQQVGIGAGDDGLLAPGDTVVIGRTATDDHCISNNCGATPVDHSASLNGNTAPDGGDIWANQTRDLPNGYRRRSRRRVDAQCHQPGYQGRPTRIRRGRSAARLPVPSPFSLVSAPSLPFCGQGHRQTDVERVGRVGLEPTTMGSKVAPGPPHRRRCDHRLALFLGALSTVGDGGTHRQVPVLFPHCSHSGALLPPSGSEQANARLVREMAVSLEV
jgi:hypothetical protein